jgi:hypothetical protein
MTNGFLTNLFSPEGFFQFLGWAIIIMQFMYIVAALIMTREISLMNRSFKTNLAPLFTVVAYANLLFAIGLLIATITVI